MATGTPFTPAQFTTTQVAPVQPSVRRVQPYISPTEYRFAPTAVSSQRLVAGSASSSLDSTASLYQVLLRASSWADEITFHRSKGSFQASNIVESGYVQVQLDGGLALICNVKPVIEATGLAIGATPSQLGNVNSAIAADLWIEDRIIRVPSTWSTNSPPIYAYPTDTTNRCYVVWSYVAGYPNYQLSANIAKTDTAITLRPAMAGDTKLPGIYAGTPLTIFDGSNTETLVASSTPTGLVVQVQSNPQFAHTVLASPDFIRVSSLPGSIEQAVIHLTSVLIKTQGTRAMVMGTMGGAPSGQAMAMAGTGDEFGRACALLKRHQIVYLHD